MKKAERKFHILVVPSWSANTYNSGAGSFVVEQAVALKNAGHTVGMLSSTPIFWFYIKRFRKMFKPLDSRRQNSGITELTNEILQIPPYGPLWIKKVVSILNRARQRRAYVRLFKKYIRANGLPDVVHFHSFTPAVLAEYIASKYNLPLIVTEHWSGFLEQNRVSKCEREIKTMYLNVKKVLAVSEFLGSAVKKVIDIEYEVVSNCVANIFLNINTTKNKKFTFFAAGYHVPVKRYDRLLEEFSAGFKGRLDVQLNLAGHGQEFLNLERQAQALGIKGQVNFLGQLNRSDLALEMSKSHALVSSSDVETFGVTLIEALALGIPCVCTDSGGPKSIITSSDYGLITSKKQGALRAGMEELFQNYSLFDKNRIRNYASKTFSERAIVKKLEDVYNSQIG